MLELKHISKVYKTLNFEQKALNNVSVCFRENEFAAILGPSGSGKTTLLNIVGGLDHYDHGDLIINGISTKKYNDRAWDTYRNHRVGFVFQNYNLISHQSVLSNVELALTLSGIDKKTRRKKAKEALKEVGLEDHIYKRPNQLSGGQMQRVAIARALINDPDIILADEPTGALDSETSIQVMNILKKIAKDKLVIMVTHNPELADTYANRIIKLKDGKIIDDTNPFEEENKKEDSEITKKPSMNIKTAISLSLNNLMTKKGRTFLTAFAGSIGIIGIALILSLSNGIQHYIDKTEEETLSSYPLVIEKESVDMSSMLNTFMGKAEKKEYEDKKIHSNNIMGNVFTSINQEVKSNDLKTFKKYLENNKEIKNYVSDIQYGYDVILSIYKNDTDNLVQVNPTTVLDAVGMGTSSISSMYSSYMSNYNVFTELMNNDTLNKKQYDIVDGRWPSKYNEVVLMVNENNEISDYTLYALGILSQDELKQQFVNLTTGKEVHFEDTSYTTKELLDLTFKLVINTDIYEKKGILWVDMSNDTSYMKEVLKKSEELKVVGIIKPNEEAITSGASYGLVGYRHDLVEHVIDKINASKIVKEQKEKEDINVFTGVKFTTSSSFDMASLSKEQQKALASMSKEELAAFMQNYATMTSSYEENMKKLNARELDDPYTISIFPKDFDSKEEIESIIEDYNKDKKDEDKIKYTDIVGVMMSSVSTIVNVISSVLIAFVAISLVVSSIMIAIITYISVIERTKEIGILRAIGASKKDVRRVFNAETMIEGFAAGFLGIIVTLLLNIPINLIIKKIVNISNIAMLPSKGAIILILISIFLTVVAGFIPAKIASKKDPVEALRTE